MRENAGLITSETAKRLGDYKRVPALMSFPAVSNGSFRTHRL